MKKYNIEVEISNLDVGVYYYSFNYSIKIDGKLVEESEYSSDYDNGLTPEEWKARLAAGLALEYVLENVSW